MNENNASTTLDLKDYRMTFSEMFWFMIAILSAMSLFKALFLFGFHFLFFFLAGVLIIALLPSLALAAIFYFFDKKKPLNNVRLDGEGRELHFKEARLPYDEIKKVAARDYGRFIRIKFVREKGRPLVALTPSGGDVDKDLIFRELGKITSPFAPGRKINLSPLRLFLSMSLFALLFFVVGHEYYYHQAKAKEPAIALKPEEIRWVEPAGETSGWNSHLFEGIRFSLPPGYTKKAGISGPTLVFRDQTNKTTVMASQSFCQAAEDLQPRGFNDKLFQIALGLYSCRDYYEWVYSSRFGLLPILFRSVEFPFFGTYAMEKFRYNNYYGLVKRGKKNDRAMIEATLVDMVDDREIMLTFISEQEVDEGIFRGVVSSALRDEGLAL